MALPAGTHTLGPDNAVLRVRTGREGKAAKAGHDLVIEVTSWEGRLSVGSSSGDVSLELDADASSLRVREGSGGVQALGDEDKDEIRKSIDDEVLKGDAIEFRSTSVETSDDRMSVRGDLSMVGASHPVEFELAVGEDGSLSGQATLTQSDWGIKPYSALFGALKVSDEVKVEVEGSL